MSSNKTNPFYTDDDVDDDDFLRKPRPSYMLPHHGGGGGGVSGSSSSPFSPAAAPQQPQQPSMDDRRQQLMQRRREIENRTLESSNRSLGLLYESEKVGIATADELSRQKEQLQNTEHRLDEINSTLKQSERHLTGIKSVFGGIRNYFAGKNNPNTAVSTTAAAGGGGMPSSAAGGSGLDNRGAGSASSADAGRLDSMRNASHPGLRMRGLDDGGGGGASSSSAVDDVLDRNLDEMSLGLSRLKDHARNMNRELDDHNELLDRLDHKTSSTVWRVDKQNKDMNKLLKK